MVQFPPFASRIYEFNPRWPGMTPAGLPHSEISGSKPARGSPELIAACCVLHRFSAPRHPPHALSSLTSTLLGQILMCAEPQAQREYFAGGLPEHQIVKEPADCVPRGVAAPTAAGHFPQGIARLVEASGFEPLTSCLQSRRSPS